MKKAIIAIAGAGLLASACASDPYNNYGTNETVRQGAIGAAAGAVVGGLLGNGSGNTAQGAAIGASRSSSSARTPHLRTWRGSGRVRVPTLFVCAKEKGRDLSIPPLPFKR